MRLPGQPDSRLALAWLLALFIVLLLLMAGPRLNGQSVSEPGQTSLRQSLTVAERTLTQLVDRLNERQQQVLDLRASLTRADARLSDLAESYASLQQTLEAAQASLTESQSALMATSTSLDSLSTRYDALEQRWQDYRSEMVAQITTLERQYTIARRWAVGFGVSTAVGFILSLIMALR